MSKPNFNPDDSLPEKKVREYLTDKGHDPIDFPERLDWMAKRIVKDGAFHLNSGNPLNTDFSDTMTSKNFSRGCDTNYREGVAELLDIDNVQQLNLPNKAGENEIGELVYNFTKLSRDFEKIEESPGEALIQYANKKSQRESENNVENYLPRIRVDAGTPQELIQQLAYNSDKPGEIIKSLDGVDAEEIEDSLAKIQLADELWPHQRKALKRWLGEYDKTGYVKMATASGKTVLGIAAIVCTAAAEDDWMHENDDIMDDIETESVPSGSDFLVIMDSNLLKNQWIDMMKKHCYIPDDYVTPTEDGFQFPWGTIEFQTIQAVEKRNTEDYDLVIFDEFHEYVGKGEYRDTLNSFIDSDNHILALSASDESVDESTEKIDSEFERILDFPLDEAIKQEIISDFDWEVHYTSVEGSAPGLEKIERANELWERRIEESDSGVRLKGIGSWVDEIPVEDGKDREDLDQYFDGINPLIDAIEDIVNEKAVADERPLREMIDIKDIFKGYRQHWWNLRPSYEKIVSVIKKETEKGRPCIVFTNSYPEAESLEEALSHLDDVNKITVLENDPDKNNKLRNEYNDHDGNKKVLIGPKRTIGKGTDLPEAEVGVNLAGTKQGVNQQLVQLVGRILREEGGRGTFYNIKGLPDKELLFNIDTADIVGHICEFRGEGNEKLGSKPSIVVDECRYQEMAFIEQSGIERLEDDELTPEEKTLKHEVQKRESTSYDIPTVTKIWEQMDSKQKDSSDENKRKVQEKPETMQQSKDSSKEVQISPVVYALIEATVDEDQTKSSLVDSALGEYTREVAKKGVNSVSERTVPERNIDIDLNPLLKEVARLRANESGFEDPDKFVKSKLLKQMNIPEAKKNIVISQYEQYEMIIEVILDSGPAWAENPSDVVETALIEYFNVNGP